MHTPNIPLNATKVYLNEPPIATVHYDNTQESHAIRATLLVIEDTGKLLCRCRKFVEEQKQDAKTEALIKEISQEVARLQFLFGIKEYKCDDI